MGTGREEHVREEIAPRLVAETVGRGTTRESTTRGRGPPAEAQWRMPIRRARLGILLVALAALLIVGCMYRGYLAGFLPGAAAEVSDITLPPGFRISVFAADVPNARQMALGPPGIVFVGSRAEGKVYAVVDRDGDHRADELHVLASGLNMPSGVAYRDGALYVAAVSRILRFPDVARDLQHPPPPEVVSSAYPSDGHHG